MNGHMNGHANGYIPIPDEPTASTGIVKQDLSTFSGGTIGGDDYASLLGIDATTAKAQHRLMGHRRVIIVGCGVNGIHQASTLLKDGSCKLSEMVMFDSLKDFGGVWEKNKYPGCACDVPAMVYTTSYYVNKFWTHFFGTREEIQKYYHDMATSYGLPTIARFSSFVKSCRWDSTSMLWHVQVVNGQTGIVENWTSDVICQCVGFLDRPKFGTTPGREDFKGISWHTAHWRDDVDLTGKRVAIIGCGPSAAQIIPEIVDKTSHLTVYMRTPPVCVPRNDYAYGGLMRFAMRYLPGFAWLVRLRMNLRFSIWGKRMATVGDYWNNRMTKIATDFVKREIKDPELQAKVMPDHQYYCKRPLRLDHFYSSLAKPNCTVLRSKLVRYTERGVVSVDVENGPEVEREFDVIIFGTGFNVAQYLEHEKITGIDGVELQEKWKSHPECLYGMSTAGYPNMFMIFGPNSATVWIPPQDTWELQASLVSKFVREIVRRERRGIKLAVSPNRTFERAYNIEVQEGQSRLVWQQASCQTYYKNDAGWNTFAMPWHYPKFWMMIRKIRWDEWDVIEAPLTKLIAATALQKVVR